MLQGTRCQALKPYTTDWLGLRAAQAKVADFGLARRMQPRGAQDGSCAMAAEATVVLGTFGYVAPEYARTGALCIYWIDCLIDITDIARVQTLVWPIGALISPEKVQIAQVQSR